MVSLVSFLLVIGICVIIHELGHYFTARIFDVQVHEFAFGMGPVLLQRQGRHTMWSFRAFPVGGFVRLAGMGEDHEEEVVEEGRGFFDKAAWKRFLILANGSVSNILLAMLLTVFFLSGHGVINLESTEIGEIMEGYPAQTAGILPGDAIVAVNDLTVSSWREMSASIRTTASEGPVLFSVLRKGETLSLTVTIPPDAQGIPLLGIRPAMRRYSVLEAFASAFTYTVDMTFEMVRGIIRWITGVEKVDVTGPVGIASMAGDAARRGMWPFVTFLALINLNLGLLNLFPFPALDGGRLIFTAGEMLLRRRLPARIENFIHMSGFVLLLLLIVYVTWQDILRFF